MSDIEFRFVQPNEFDDWYYEVYDNLVHYINIIYNDGEWCAHNLKYRDCITQEGLKNLLNKIKELNAATKPKNRFGF